MRLRQHCSAFSSIPASRPISTAPVDLPQRVVSYNVSPSTLAVSPGKRVWTPPFLPAPHAHNRKTDTFVSRAAWLADVFLHTQRTYRTAFTPGCHLLLPDTLLCCTANACAPIRYGHGWVELVYFHPLSRAPPRPPTLRTAALMTSRTVSCSCRICLIEDDDRGRGKT